MEFKNLDSLYAYLENVAIPEALSTTVAEVAIDTGVQHTQSDVYDAYTPTQYDRSFDLIKSWRSQLISNNTLEITNTRSEGTRDIVSVIEFGKGYWTQALDNLIGARPFMENTRDQLASGLAVKAMQEGLNSLLGAGVLK